MILFKGDQVRQMMKVVGEEGTSIGDFELYLKSDFFDAVYIQQNGFDPVDASTDEKRQKYVFSKIINDILKKEFSFKEKDEARKFFYNLRHAFIDWNYKAWQTDSTKKQEEKIDELIKGNLK